MRLTEGAIKYIQAVQAAVVEKGADHIYDRSECGDAEHNCTYLNYRDGGGVGSCLVGRGLLNSGLMTPDALEQYEGTAAHLVVPFGQQHPVSQASRHMQDAQDKGVTWGVAYGIMLGFLAANDVDTYDFLITG